MALDDVPLEDAGREYYAKQFGERVKNIRKAGATPPSRSGGNRANGWAAGGGVVVALIVIRLIVTAVVAANHSSSSSYNSYQPTTTFTVPPRPVQVVPNGPNVPPDEQRMGEAMRRLLGRDPTPPVAPDDRPARQDKDD